MGSSHSEELDILLRAPTSGSSSQIKHALVRLSSEIKERAERGSIESFDFFVAATNTISRIKGSAHIELRFSCLLASGQYFYCSGSMPNAITAARSARDVARRSGNKHLVRVASVLSGVVYAEFGDVAEAVVHYAAALELARELDDRRGEGIVLMDLGTALDYGALYHDALECSQRAVVALTAAGAERRLLAAAYTNMAQSYLHLETYDRGFDVIQQALALSESPTDASLAFSSCIRELIFVQLALEVGALESAREHSRVCRQHSQWGANPRAGVIADIAEGLCEVRNGDVARGLELLDSSLLHSDDVILRTDALTALAKAHGEVGNADKALHCMRELLKTVRAAREMSIRALMALSKDSDSGFVANPNDMRALELRESRLETKVAEREVFHCRLEMLERLAIAADLKEEDSGEHGYRVGRLSALLATDLGWEPEACTALEMAARLHDIGKVGVPDRILFTSHKLKDAEREFIATHTMIGSEMLAKSDIPHLRIAQEIALHHHEWWDGEGYPSKLRGLRIPLHARIVALADVFDAMTHGRPFADAWPIEQAIAEIRRRRGTQFDPELTDPFLALIERLAREHPDLDEYLGRAGRNSPFLQARSRIRKLLAEKHAGEEKTALQDSEIPV